MLPCVQMQRQHGLLCQQLHSLCVSVTAVICQVLPNTMTCRAGFPRTTQEGVAMLLDITVTVCLCHDDCHYHRQYSVSQAIQCITGNTVYHGHSHSHGHCHGTDTMTDLNSPSHSSLKLMRRSEFWSHMENTASNLRSWYTSVTCTAWHAVSCSFHAVSSCRVAPCKSLHASTWGLNTAWHGRHFWPHRVTQLQVSHMKSACGQSIHVQVGCKSERPVAATQRACDTTCSLTYSSGNGNGHFHGSCTQGQDHVKGMSGARIRGVLH